VLFTKLLHGRRRSRCGLVIRGIRASSQKTRWSDAAKEWGAVLTRLGKLNQLKTK